MESEIKKKCTKCDVPKVLDEFHLQARGKYGRDSKCKECVAEINRIYRNTPKARERHRLYEKQWRKDNHDHVLELNKVRYKKNADKYNAGRREQYKTDESFRAKRRAHEIKYKESGRRSLMNKLNPKHRERADKYKKEHPEKTRKQAREYREKKWRKVEQMQRCDVRDEYVVRVIQKQARYNNIKISCKEIPQDVIELKRKSILLKRELKKLNNENREQVSTNV